MKIALRACMSCLSSWNARHTSLQAREKLAKDTIFLLFVNASTYLLDSICDLGVLIETFLNEKKRKQWIAI